jgi:predicted amidohydrolase
MAASSSTRAGYHGRADMTAILAACAQLTSTADVSRNLATCRRLIEAAAARGAKLAVLPENFAFVGAKEQDKFAVAEPLDEARPGPILASLAAAAKATGLWIVGGGMPEASPDPNKVWNTAVVIRPDGSLAARYRKIHLFDVDIPGGAQFKESGTVAPGDAVVTTKLPWFTLGLSICYDLRFPELYRRLVAEGAQVIVVPAAFTLHTGKDHWRPLLTARAIENQVYVLAPGQFGRPFENRACWGHSLIVDPWGAVLAEAGDRECAIVAELDLELQAKVRRELPCLGHRRV